MLCNKKTSRIVYGCCNEVLMNSYLDSEVLLEKVFQRGVRTFDTARIYGDSERNLGRWIKRNNHRDDVIIVTKGGHPNTNGSRLNKSCIFDDLNESLRELDTDYIDIFLLHRDDHRCDINELLETLNDCVDRGKIRKFGASNWTSDRIEEVNEYAKKHNMYGFSISSPQFSIMDQVRDPWGECVTLGGKKGEKQREWYVNNQMPVLAWSSLAGGFASGKIKSRSFLTNLSKINKESIYGYFCFRNIHRLKQLELLSKQTGYSVAQISIAWLIRQGINVFPICTSTNEKSISEIVEALNIDISSNDIERIGLQRKKHEYKKTNH